MPRVSPPPRSVSVGGRNACFQPAVKIDDVTSIVTPTMLFLSHPKG